MNIIEIQAEAKKFNIEYTKEDIASIEKGLQKDSNYSVQQLGNQAYCIQEIKGSFIAKVKFFSGIAPNFYSLSQVKEQFNDKAKYQCSGIEFNNTKKWTFKTA